MENDPPIRVGIVGVGLIGGSIASAVALAFPGADIILFDRNAEHARWLASRVEGSRVIPGLASLSVADLVFVSTPVSAIAGLVRQLDALLSGRAVIVDCGSAKTAIIAAIRATGPPIPRYVPGHPMGGGTISGPFAASAEIIQGKPFILCEAAETAPGAMDRAEQILTKMGALPFRVAPDAHDRMVAFTSHLPHMAAYALTGAVLGKSSDLPPIDDPLIAASFRTISEYVLGDGELWADIFLANKAELLRALDDFEGRLEELRLLIESQNRDGLIGHLQDLGAARRTIVDPAA